MSVGFSRIKTSHCLRVTCATRLFQSNVEDKLIREHTGHRSNALLVYEKESEQQNIKVSKILGPPEQNNNVEEKNDVEDLFFDFDVSDDLLSTSPELCPDLTRYFVCLSLKNIWQCAKIICPLQNQGDRF